VTPTATLATIGAPRPVGTSTATVTPTTASPTPERAGQTPAPGSTPAATEAEPSPAPLELPWPPPGNFAINVDGGRLDGLAAIWGNKEFPISQEFGHTDFSILHFAWYAYGLGYGLDGYEHPGLDIAMPAGTWLYSPVEGTVKISGGTPYYTFYGNGSPNVGELLIVTDDGDEVILGHMGRIAVDVGDRVEVGQFVGLSGGDNGDHLHLEVRELEFGIWHRIVDPRKSFVVGVLKEAAERNKAHPSATPVPGATPVPDGGWQQPGWYESGSG
jgi:murein DD-endopeptidase MepM/ murein hydrolase activator NlpD